MTADTSRGSPAWSQAAGKFTRHAQGFWRWWTGELKAMVPRRLRPWLLPRDTSLFVYPSGGGFRVSCSINGQYQDLGMLPGPGDETPLPEEIERLLPSVGHISLCWPEGDALLRNVSLPGETRERLADVIGFELDRLTPFRAEQVYFGHHLLGQDTQANTLEVEIQVVPRPAADRAIGALAQRGLTVSALVLDTGARDDLSTGMNLAPGLGRSGPGKGRRRPWLLAAVAAILLVVALAIPQYRNLERIEQLEQVLESERAGALAASQMRDALQALREEGKRFATRRAQNPTLVETLDELSRVLPDGTWLTSAEIRQDRARIQGLSDSASGLIALVESSPLFRNAEFTAPVTHDQTRNLDQFVLETTLGRREGEP
jgi:general secretion pathway protein L